MQQRIIASRFSRDGYLGMPCLVAAAATRELGRINHANLRSVGVRLQHKTIHHTAYNSVVQRNTMQHITENSRTVVVHSSKVQCSTAHSTHGAAPHSTILITQCTITESRTVNTCMMACEVSATSTKSTASLLLLSLPPPPNVGTSTQLA